MSTKEKNLEEEDSEENILDEKNFQEKIKNYMEKHGKSWLWVSIGIVIVYYFFIWYMFFIGISSLFNAIFYTIFYPLVVFFLINYRKLKHKVLINKIMLIGGLGSGITVVICLFAGYILFWGPWALLQDVLPANSRLAIALILMGAIYGIVAYILYRFGKKREWKILPDYSKARATNLSTAPC
jgi:amino acid transporter